MESSGRASGERLGLTGGGADSSSFGSLDERRASGNRVHARSFASTFVLEIGGLERAGSTRACPFVLGLAYPSRTPNPLSGF